MEKLDWDLPTAQERSDYVKNLKLPSDNTTLEKIANYILWGKESDGKNLIQKHEIQIETKSAWYQTKQTDSLDALLEIPGFNESSFTDTPLKTSPEKFSRKRALKNSPPHIQIELIKLFYRIDKIELLLNFCDLNSGRRTNQPRPELLNRFSQNTILSLKSQSLLISPTYYSYLKKLLIDLRKEQFTYKDLYKQTIQKDYTQLTYHSSLPNTIMIGEDIIVKPIGLITELPEIFQPFGSLDPKEFNQETLNSYLKFYWKKDSSAAGRKVFDFTDLESVYQLLFFLPYKNDFIEEDQIESNFAALLSTLEFYIEMAELTEVQREILHFKINKTPNDKIRSYINKKYNTSYTENYISTIFRQKIIPKINAAAKLHLKIFLNLTFPENFKRCRCCGQILLTCEENFVRKTRAADGFTNRCKSCDRKKRKGEI